MVSKWMDKLRRGSGLDSHGNAYQFPYEKEAIKEIERLQARVAQLEFERAWLWDRYDAVAKSDQWKADLRSALTAIENP